MTSDQAMIRVSNVTHHYGVRPVLRGVSMEVRRGEVVSVMGPNGMGKSTLLGVIGGVLWPLRGSVEIDGMRRRSDAGREGALREKVVYLPDHPWLPANRTGREFLLAVGRLYGHDDEPLMDHVDRLLSLFHLDRQGDSPIRSYSSGQKKKAAIAGALVAKAPVLVLDEPFSGGLDPSAILALRRVLQHLARRGEATIVMAAPTPELVEELSDRIAVLREGELIAHDEASRLRERTGCDGPFEEVLERLLQPDTLDRIDRYFEGESR